MPFYEPILESDSIKETKFEESCRTGLIKLYFVIIGILRDEESTFIIIIHHISICIEKSKI